MREIFAGVARLVRHPVDSVRVWLLNMRDSRP